MTKFTRSLLIMMAMFAGMTVFYLNKFDLNVKSPVPLAAAALQKPITTGPQAISLAADASGHFITDIRINGNFVRGLVDTGATVIALPLADAKKLGITPPQSAFTSPIRTANGEVKGAKVRLNEVRIGTVVARDIEALVVPTGLDVTLIGMSFFNRLSSFEMRGKTLVLRQ